LRTAPKPQSSKAHAHFVFTERGLCERLFAFDLCLRLLLNDSKTQTGVDKTD